MFCKCVDCGCVFDFEDRANWTEDFGESNSGCPTCGGGYEEAVKCDCCGEWFLEDELSGGVCDSCIDSNRFDVDVCYQLGKKDMVKIEINGLFYNLFSEKEINEILWNYLTDNGTVKKVDCIKFINEDRRWFGESLAIYENKKGGEVDENTKEK